MEGYNLLEVLKHVNPSGVSYQEWVNVGMALKEEGYSPSDWDEWSRADTRYRKGECMRKWESFHGNGAPVRGGTIVQLARENGWQPDQAGHELGWDDAIERDELVVIDRNWVEAREVREPGDWNPVKELTTYLETLFESTENVGYVTRTYEKEGRFLPEKGCWDRTAGQLIQLLNKSGNQDVRNVVGDYNELAGAWIRFNPLDGRGCKNENVTEYRYALVESDDMDIDRQNAMIRELELPVACLVHSGNKSLHAIVRIDAADNVEYRKRVDYLYDVCQKNGFKTDTQNRNSSRLSRMPGVMREGRKQFLVDTNIGKEGWQQWYEWIEGVNDDLPEPESMADTWDNLPDLAPPLIDNVLRQGHKMLLAGPSKAGKSFALIEMCIAIAEGRKWLSWPCTRGRTLYVNLELDRASCLHRFKDVYAALGWQPNNLANIDIWNLRGKSVPMDKLAPKLIRRAAKKNYIAIIIDPIYKVITGDENSADQMAAFCNQFDKVCTELGCAVIYCHHHSKGSQGGKRSMDRASGSGVFARDPDALIDLIELELTEAALVQAENKAVCMTCIECLNSLYEGWEDDVSQDDTCSSSMMLHYCKKKLLPGQHDALNALLETARKKLKTLTAWRIEGTLREYPKFEPVSLWFDYPTHRVDDTGMLHDIQPDEDKPFWQKGTDNRKKSAKTTRDKINADLEMAYASCSINGDVTVKDLMEYWNGMSEKGVKDRIKKSGEFYYENGIVYQKEEKADGNEGQ